jgi:hypothetical protein
MDGIGVRFLPFGFFDFVESDFDVNGPKASVRWFSSSFELGVLVCLLICMGLVLVGVVLGGM